MGATGTINGEEARGTVEIRTVDGVQMLVVSDMWVATGAPDARLYASIDPTGGVTNESIEICKIPDGTTHVEEALPAGIDPESTKSIVVHCTEYSVYFGHAELTWAD